MFISVIREGGFARKTNEVRECLLLNIKNSHGSTQTSVSRIAVSNRLAEVGELVETEALSTIRQKLKKMERTRHLAVWHDHSSVANHRYFLFLVGIMYDPAIHLTNKEFKENCGKEVEVQKIIEKPELYIVARYLYMYNPMVLKTHSIDNFK